MPLDNLERIPLDNLLPARGGFEDKKLGFNGLDGWA
jgi:hypothetical protein